MRYFLDFWVQVYLDSLSRVFQAHPWCKYQHFISYGWINISWQEYDQLDIWVVPTFWLLVTLLEIFIHKPPSVFFLTSLPSFPSLSFFHYIKDIENIYVVNVQWYFMILICISLRSSILAQKIPGTVEPGRLQSMGSQSPTQLGNWAHTHAVVNAV